MDTIDRVNAFPALPDFKASWRPLYWEPILESGERITFALLIKSPTDVQIHSVLRPAAMRALYGKKSAGVRGFSELVVDSLRTHLSGGHSPNSWQPPISGIYMGKWRDSVSFGIDGILSQAVQQVSSLSWKDLAATTQQDLGASTSDTVRRRLVDQVRDVVVSKRMELARYFDQDAKLVDDGVPVRFGFLCENVVAHFGLLRPTDLGRSYKDARGRLWELQKANRRAEFKHASLILQLPSSDDLYFDEKQLELAQSALHELRTECEDEKVEVLEVHTPPEAADQLLKLAA